MGDYGNPPLWETVTQRKRLARDDLVPAAWRIKSPCPDTLRPIDFINCEDNGVLTKEDLAITDTSTDAVTLLETMSSRQLSAEAVVTAFCKRAAVAHQLTNCLTEIMFSEAIDRARWLDSELDRTGKTVGPLHGLPISIKDNFFIKGYDSSVGIAEWCNKPAAHTSQCVQILLDAGAVVVTKTTVPQTMLTADTDSVVWGRTVNPYNAKFGAAGSSGGEAALIAMGGSALGLGTDGAGSVRMPAAVCGIVGYKPSGYRLPMDGQRIMDKGCLGTTVIGSVSVPGFLGRSLRDVTLATKLVSDAEPWASNPFLLPSPWQKIDCPKPRIGVWLETDFIHFHPPVARGIRLAMDRLRAAGHDVVELKTPPPMQDSWDLQKDFCEMQGLTYIRDILSREPHTDIVKATGVISRDRAPLLPTLETLHALNEQQADLNRRTTAIWNEERLDAILTVTAAHTAVPFDAYTYLGLTGHFNLIDWPAIALPLNEFVDEGLDAKVSIEPHNALDRAIQNMYDPAAFHGLPLSVQLIGRRFQDEKLLAVAALLHGDMSKADSPDLEVLLGQ